jgi:tetratricopeptide (TPR) repeat protein
MGCIAAMLPVAAHAETFVSGSADDPHVRAACFLAADGERFAAAAELRRLRAQASDQPPEVFCRQLAGSMPGPGMPERTELTAAARPADYNAGIAALREGNIERGFAALDTLGQSKGSDSVSLALRDKANLSLAYYLLRNGDPARAIPLFDRIRSPGPYSNPALLGLGWAFLVPSGQKQEVAGSAAGPAPEQKQLQFGAEDYEITKQRRRTPFRYDRTVVTGERELDVRRALVPWVELIGRDPLDPAVQEGMLAIPYALGHLGAHQQAHTYYLRAIDTLERMRIQLDQALAHVGSGRMASTLVGRDRDAGSGWPVLFADLPKARWWLKFPESVPETFYLEHLIEDGGFREALADCRQLRLLGEVLDKHEQDIRDRPGDQELRARIASLRSRIGAAYAIQQKHMEEMALAALQQQKQQTERYLAEARFAVARLNDRPQDGGYK